MLVANLKIVEQGVLLKRDFRLFKWPLGMVHFRAIQLPALALTIKAVAFRSPYFERIIITVAGLGWFVSSLKGRMFHLMRVVNRLIP